MALIAASLNYVGFSYAPLPHIFKLHFAVDIAAITWFKSHDQPKSIQSYGIWFWWGKGTSSFIFYNLIIFPFHGLNGTKMRPFAIGLYSNYFGIATIRAEANRNWSSDSLTKSSCSDLLRLSTLWADQTNLFTIILTSQPRAAAVNARCSMMIVYNWEFLRPFQHRVNFSFSLLGSREIPIGN